MPFSGYTSKITPTACVLSGSWISTTGTPGVVVTGSNVGSDGTGTYYCSTQTSRHLKIVQFEVTRAYGGKLSVKALAAGYLSCSDCGESSSETSFASSSFKSVNVAETATSSAYGISSVTYFGVEGIAPPFPPAPPPSSTVLVADVDRSH
eukprot:6855689-Prymnesium_polylepis.1